jgi:ketosteroid isomerase-like protein
MSQENVEVVRESLEAFSRRDIEALRRVTAADVELDWSASRGWLAGVYRGFDEVMRFYEGYYEAFEETVVEAESYIPTGDLVVVPNVAHQRGRDGIEVTARAAFVFTVRGGKLAKLDLYQETPEALKAVGLEDG